MMYLNFPAYTRRGNADGAQCHFPFIYKGSQYFSCTTADHNSPWCAIVPNYDAQKAWGLCAGEILLKNLHKVACDHSTVEPVHTTIPQMNQSYALVLGAAVKRGQRDLALSIVL